MRLHAPICRNTSLTQLHAGVLTQFAIVIGIMITQAMGLSLATPREWRIVLLFSAALSALQLLASALIVESPVWLHRRGLLQDKAAASRKLWAVKDVLVADPECTCSVLWSRFTLTWDLVPSDSSRDPLLADAERDAEDRGAKDPEEHQAAVSLPQLFTAPELRKPLIIVCFSMLCQQLSGVNAGTSPQTLNRFRHLTFVQSCTTATTSCRKPSLTWDRTFHWGSPSSMS